VEAGSDSPFDPIVRGHLEKAVDSLVEEFGELYPRERIRDLVEQSADELARGRVSDFVPALSHRFARERLKALAQSEGRLAKDVPQVLFVSLTGGGRAQMAAALLSERAGDRIDAHSAGSQAGPSVDENVRHAMHEVGIDLSQAFTKPLTREVLAGADVVVTMGRSVGAVDIPATTRHIDWRVGDPDAAPLDEVRRVREDIERRVEALADELLALSSS
jgi:protein-tyrosine-phosphatase